MKYNYLTMSMFAIVLAGCGAEDNKQVSTKAKLGASLFSDKTLSFNRNMSCATCHDSSNAFIDPRTTSRTLGASLGDDNTSIGDRNTPSALYASFSPDFHFDSIEGLFIGGQFLDGRALDLKEQAKGPFVNPLEMGMPDAASVVSRVKENPDYVTQFQSLFGTAIFDNDDSAYDAVADCIASFEKSSEFATFDSKYDRFLDGNYTLNVSEERGMAIFSNEENIAGAGRCTLCHPITTTDDSSPLMTDFSYDNVGVPVNTALRDANGQGTTLDTGLFSNPAVNDVGLKGAFKVASLRNVAVTSPYMHNGLFKDLKTVVHFYNTRDVSGTINPETSLAWEEGEFHTQRNIDELGNLGLSGQDEDDLVAFMKTFTDARYEGLLN